MSWTSLRDSQSSSNYRYISFAGGRILQSRELTDLQDINTGEAYRAFGTVFNEGAVFNANFSVSGTATINLTSKNAGAPVVVYFNGRFEDLPASWSYTFPSVKQSGSDFVYLHWVLWRVSADGTHSGQSGCLTDATLIDITTSEAAAERGQVQFILSTDASLSSETLNPITQLAKSLSPIPIVNLNWATGQLQILSVSNVNADMYATATQGGFVKLTSSSSSGVAVASDDYRLSDPRTVVPLSVSDPQIVNTTPRVGSVSPIGTPYYDPTLTTIKIVQASLGCLLSDFVDWCYAKVSSFTDLFTDHETRIVTLETNKKATGAADLSAHINQPLGLTGPHGTHPPTTNSPNVFTHTGTGSGSDNAFVAKNQGNTTQSRISCDGNYHLDNSSFAVTGVPSDFAGLLQFVGTLKPSTAGVISSLLGDVSGVATTTSVDKVKGIPVDASRIDGTAPQTGDALTMESGRLKFVPPGGSPPAFEITDISVVAAGTILWLVFTIGSHKIGVGVGPLPSEGVMLFPDGWNAVSTVVSTSLAVIPAGGTQAQVQLLPPSAGNEWKAEIHLDGTAADAGWYVHVNAFSVSV